MTTRNLTNVRTAQERAVNACTRKKVYRSYVDAEHAADSVALREWRRGVDKALKVYECTVCGCYHVGTVASRPVHPALAALHDYKVLESPRTIEEVKKCIQNCSS